MKRLFALFAILTLCSFFIVPTMANATPPTRVYFVPSSAALTEGESQEVIVALTEPIICSDIELPCDVTLPLVVSDPTRATTSVDHLTFASDEWFLQKTFTLNAVNDYKVNSSNTITLGTTVVSNSEYYSNFHISMTITLTDLGAAPKPTAGYGTSQSQSTSLSAGKSISLSGTGYKPDTDVTVTLYSTPKVLGTVRTDSSGNFSGTFKIARSTSAGAHEVVVSGFDLGGNATSATLTLKVAGLANSGSHTWYLVFVSFSLMIIGSALQLFVRGGSILRHA